MFNIIINGFIQYCYFSIILEFIFIIFEFLTLNKIIINF